MLAMLAFSILLACSLLLALNILSARCMLFECTILLACSVLRDCAVWARRMPAAVSSSCAFSRISSLSWALLETDLNIAASE